MTIQIIQTIALKDLIKSNKNVRKHSGCDKALNSLIASIKANGLINPLTVTLKDKIYHVIAGGRRLEALFFLAKDKQSDFNMNSEIPCTITDETIANEISLAENVCREKMHPVDEFRAFAKSVKQGKTIKEIAVIFGVSELFVKQRMALSDVHEDILNLCLQDEISLSELKAFTVTTNKAKQIKYIENNGFMNEHSIRNTLTEQDYTCDENIFEYVTNQAYIKKGGELTRDLFGDETFYHNKDIVEKCFDDVIQPVIDAITSLNLKWIKIHYQEISYEEKLNYVDFNHKTKKKETQVLLTKLDELSNRLSEEKNQTKRKEIISKIVNNLTQQSELITIDEDKKAYCGTVISIAWNGSIEMKIGVAIKKDYKEYISLQETTATDKQEEVNHFISAALRDEFRSHKLELKKLALLHNPKEAKELILFSLIHNYFNCNFNYNFSIINNEFALKNSVETLANKNMKVFFEKLNTKWLKDDEEQSFEEYKNLTLKEKDALLVFVSAMNASISLSDSELKLDKHKHFRPTKENYFGRLKLPHLQEICTEIMGIEWITENLNLKKKDLVQKMEDIFLGKDKSINEKTMEKVNSWLPKELD